MNTKDYKIKILRRHKVMRVICLCQHVFCYFCFSVRPDCWWIAPNAYTAVKWF